MGVGRFDVALLQQDRGPQPPGRDGRVGVPDPTASALADGHVMVSRGPDFGPGYDGFVRLAFATSSERLERIVDGLATAWAGGSQVG